MGNFFQGAAGANRTQAGSPIYMPGLVANDNGYKQTPMPQYSGVTPSMALATQGYGGSVLPGGALGDQMAGAAAPATAPGAMQPRPTLAPAPAPAAAFGGRSIYG
jgi:hypothetical protein